MRVIRNQRIQIWTKTTRFGTPDLEKKPQISCIMSRFGVKKKPVKKGQIGKKKSPDLVPNLGKLVPSVA
jgi:hypothetical protein